MVGVVRMAGIWDLALVFQPGAGRGSCRGWLQALGAVESETPGFGDPRDAVVPQQSAGAAAEVLRSVCGHSGSEISQGLLQRLRKDVRLL